MGGRYLVAVVMLGMAEACAAEQAAPTRVTATDSRLERLGAWHEDGDECWTPYAGSVIRFSLAGTARVYICSDPPGHFRIAAEGRAGRFVDEVWTNDHLRLRADAGVETFSIISLATREATDRGQVLLHFHGIELEEGARLEFPEHQERGPLLEFLGDSITAGAAVYGRSGNWADDSDATAVYAFKVARLLGADYWLRGFPGARCADLSRRYRWLRPGVAMPSQPDPDWVVVNTGANDRTLNQEAFRAQVRELVSEIRTVHPAVRVVLLNYFRMTPNRLPVLQALTREFPDGSVFWFDARPYLVDYSDHDVHPGPQSHERLAVALADFLRERLDPILPTP